MLSYIFVAFFLADKLEVFIWCKVSLQSQFVFNSKTMIRRLAQFWLCWQLLKKKGVKWTKSDFSLLLCIPAQNCKLDLRFSLSKNNRSFDFLSKHNISSELTNCAYLITPRCPSVRHHARGWFIPEKTPTWQWMHTRFCKTICFLFLQNVFGCRLHTLVIDVFKYTSHVCWCVFACLIYLVCLSRLLPTVCFKLDSRF